MKQIICLIISFVIATLNIQSQDREHSLVLYSNFQIEKSELPFLPSKYIFHGPVSALAYQIKSNKFLYQIDFAPFFSNETNEISSYYDSDGNLVVTDGENIKYLESSGGFLLGYQIFKTDKLAIDLYYNAKIFYNLLNYQPYTSNSYRTSNSKTGLACLIGIEPELKLKSNLSLFLLPEYRFFEFYKNTLTDANPAIPVKLRTKSSYKHYFNPGKLNVRLGIKIDL